MMRIAHGKRSFLRASVLWIVIFAAASFPSSLNAATLEYPYLYKSPRSMGMGGAGVAIGGKFDSVFINPANLTDMPSDNWEVNLLSFSLGYGKNVEDFIDDIDTASDVGDLNGDGDTSDDELTAVNNVLQEYRGANMHFDTSVLSSLARGGDAVSWGFGALGTFRMNMVPHEGFGSGGLLEVHSALDYGYIIGAAFNKSRKFHPGFSLKFINRDAVDHSFSAREIVENEDNLDDYLTDEVVTEGTAFGFDAGLIYEMNDIALKPAMGFSVLNIGDLDFGEAGSIPMTLNFGISAKAELPVLGSVLMGFDLVDVTGEFYEDSDMVKRLRMGLEVLVIDNLLSTIALRTGLYQGYGTFGADIRLTMLSLSYNTYAEEIGAYAGQRADRRHVISLAITW